MNEANDIKLKMDTLSKGNSTYASVTDLYNVHIFTDDDMKKFQIKRQDESTYFMDIGRSVFLNKSQKKNLEISDTLFLEQVSVSKKQELANNTSETNINALFIGGFVLLIFVLGMVRYNIYRAIRRKKDANSNYVYQ